MDISAYQHMNIRMTTRGKRPLRNLTPSDKVRAIQRIHNGETKASVSRDIGVPESTLRGWCKNEQKLRFMCRQLGVTNQFSSMQGLENPPEKRSRLNHHIQTPKFSPATNFDEFVYSRLPVNGLPIPSNGNNATLEKMTFNDLIKKHGLSENTLKKSTDGDTNPVPTMFTPNARSLTFDYSQLSVLQNLNLLSLLCHRTTDVNTYSSKSTEVGIRPLRSSNIDVVYDTNDISKKITGNINKSNTDISRTVMNWTKDYSDSVLIPNDMKKCPTNDTNISIDKLKSVPMSNAEPLSYSTLFQIPNIINSTDSENALFEWCKVFNASLNFMAMAAAAAALYPNTTANSTVSKNEIVRSLNNILYKDPRKIGIGLESHADSDVFANSDLSSDSFFDSEPEDLSTRSAATSKLWSSCSSRSPTPVKIIDSFFPIQNDLDI